MSTSPVEIIRTSCPRDCYDHCAIHVHRRDGEILKVVGDPDHYLTKGALCGKCALAYNGAWRDPEARLLTPLRRVGPKGSASFEPVGWDEALADIAARLQRICAEEGPQSILYSHYTGTLSLIAFLFPYRFFQRLGATEVDPDSVCNKAGEVAMRYVLGTHSSGFDPATVADSRCVLVWGANPSVTAPHVDANWLSAAAKAGTKVICIDPIAQGTARRADLHLQLRPGSDGALAFGLLHVMQRDGLVDEAFVHDHVVGWDELLPAVFEATPERTEALTGVPAALVEQAAHLYAAGPSLLWLGQGMQRQPKGGNAFRAALAVMAAAGQIGKPGAGVLYFNGPATRRLDTGYLMAPHLSPGEDREAPAPISHMDLAESLPNYRALISYANNIAASSPNQRRLTAALKADDLFHVAIDLFATDTTAYADYVLPAASFLEFDDIAWSYFDRTVIGPQTKVQEPLGQALPHQEIFRRLAAAMGFVEPELFEPDEQLIAELLQRSGSGLTFPQLVATGHRRLSDATVIAQENLRFRTPSGHIELASARAEADGHPRLPQPWADAPPIDPDALRVLSPASAWSINSSYGNDERVQRRQGPATVTVHPAEATRRGLRDGQPVELANATGTLALLLKTSADVPEGVALVPKGRWPKHDASGANANVLFDGAKADMGGSTAVHGVTATLRAVAAP